MAKDMTLAFLFDLYGELLSPRQREIFDGYYSEDLSLSELSEAYGITRQGVLQNIQTAEHKRRAWEEKVGLYRTLFTARRLAGEILQTAQGLPQGEGIEKIISLAKEIETL